MLIRRERPVDHAAVDAVHEAAFGRRAEADLLSALRRGPWWVPELSLVAEGATGSGGGGITGHVVTTRGTLGAEPALGLGPIGVAPAAQGRGIGTALVHAVLAAAEARGETLVAVLGDPAFYRRFGFRPSTELGITAPDPAWGTSFQARRLAGRERVGPFRYAAPFDTL